VNRKLFEEIKCIWVTWLEDVLTSKCSFAALVQPLKLFHKLMTLVLKILA